MLISLLPNADSDSGLDNPSSSIKLKAKIYYWTDLYSLIAPSRPAAPLQPMEYVGAMALTGSLIALTSVVFSQF
jgi:hypothetical protein